MFRTVLIANRGEIAVRIMRTLQDLGIRSVAVFSDADAQALHVARADDAVHIGPTPPRESYLNIERVIAAAQGVGADAIHPGYGFLSENADFARACAAAGIAFIGPPPEAIEAMGDKIRAKQTVEAAGVPVVPGVHRPGMSDEALIAAAAEVGYPLMVKATAGGGGKGMRVVEAADALAGAIVSARREALGAFGDDDLLLERYVTSPRHIEIQVFADTHGNVVHLGERECSLQRRHQKVIEESPSPLVDEALRARMGAAAVEAARACGYVGAGTVEFIVNGQDPSQFFFLEMNTRLQVEHPVTEEVYGVDLVQWQLRAAAGEPLGTVQEDLTPQGWAIEARVYAEDPARGFLPTGGKVLAAYHPEGLAGVRVDPGIAADVEVGSSYDPMLAKVIASADDREGAIALLHAALGEYYALGVTTNVSFLRRLLEDEDVRAGNLDTGLIERKLGQLVAQDVPDDVLALSALVRLPQEQPHDPFAFADGWRLGEHAWTGWRVQSGDRTAHVQARGTAARAVVRIDEGEPFSASVERWPRGADARIGDRSRSYVLEEDGDILWVGRDGQSWALREQDELSAARHADELTAGGPLLAPMPGSVTVVNVAPGDTVTAGQTLVVVEAMKMEHPITTPVDGTVTDVHVAAGQQVKMDQPLVVVLGEVATG